jgi:hypothetical protein
VLSANNSKTKAITCSVRTLYKDASESRGVPPQETIAGLRLALGVPTRRGTARSPRAAIDTHQCRSGIARVIQLETGPHAKCTDPAISTLLGSMGCFTATCSIDWLSIKAWYGTHYRKPRTHSTLLQQFETWSTCILYSNVQCTGITGN